MAVEFRVLGPVEAGITDDADGSAGGSLLELGTARQRCVLAVLLAEANRLVQTEQLVDRVWGEQPPQQARGTLRSYVSRLRTALAGVGEVTLARRPGGYLLAVDELAVDVHRFRHLAVEARASEGARALALWERTLELWRGEPFAGLDSPWLSETRALWEHEWFAAQLDRFDAGLHCGRHAELLGQLTALARAHPLDERLASQVMLALYRSGRQADALDHFRQIRERLAEELGTDPGSALQQLHRHILTADPATAGPPTSMTGGRPSVPRQLPAAPPLFVGREKELAELTAALHAHVETGAKVVISAIGGGGGIGKTWLALRWAYQQTARFPDGQLYVNLRGFDPTGQPTTVETALRGFLDALGAAPAEIPADTDTQATLYRSLVAGKRLLIVLDNARDTGQVVPLLPGTPTCAVVITSRNALPALTTTHGARLLPLDILNRDEARRVLTEHLGAERIAAEPAAVDELLRHCSGLPLALGIVAARAVMHATLPLTVVAEELQQAAGRLDALDVGEAELSLRTVLSWSHHALSSEAAALFALLGLAVGADISRQAVASLAALPVARVTTVLRQLETAHLVLQHAPGRYRMHDLVRLYAAELAQSLPPARREEARSRLVDFYLHTAFTAERLLEQARRPIELGRPAPGCEPHALGDVSAASAWLDAEHANLLAVQHLAVEHGWHTPVWQLAWCLTTFHYRRGHHQDLAMWQAGLTATQRLGDPAAQALAHRLLGGAYSKAGMHAEAVSHLTQALALAEQAGDLLVQAHNHFALATAWEQQGNRQQALTHATCALRLSSALGDPVWEAHTLNAVGWYEAHLSHYTPARAHCERALAIFGCHGDRTGEAAALNSLGFIAFRTGCYHRALDYYQRVLSLRRDLHDTYHQADVLEFLGRTHQALGDLDRARSAWRRALESYRTQRRLEDADRVQRYLAALDGQVPAVPGE
ncbi:AfsR/SARP family transcriptional regulator [Planobispora takensis]|uniref:SARP family transcriptional regulator n=1 Tax=Planobispora takensis TaxID=1367882 RepID=A0A8J3SXE9_9ACTN|nr:BTAD domain-containing putative transcriptional regulator [Planobispora takensis]GII01085.1 SARP family transcriptional regulator [Planobispora takensis]